MAKDARGRQQVATRIANHGKDTYTEMARKGGKNSPTKFTSESASAAAKARWEKYREQQTKKGGET